LAIQIITQNIQQIASFVETICSQLSENAHLQEFTDISDKICA